MNQAAAETSVPVLERDRPLERDVAAPASPVADDKETEKAEDRPSPEEGERSDTSSDVELDVPWRVKWISMAAVILMPLGNNWSSASLGPLKNTLRNEMGINNEQFGVISSADAIVNSAWPVMGGIILDWVGVELTAPVCTLAILLGTAVAAAGVNIGNWRVVVGGYIIQGFGTALLDSCQHVFFHALGRRQGLALAFSLENAFANATGAAARAAAIPIRDALGTQWVFWIPVFFCALSCIVNAGWNYYARNLMPAKYRPTSGRDLARGKGSKKRFSFASLWLIPWCAWLLPMTQVLQSGVVGGMQGNTADIVRMRGFREAVAGFMQSGSTVLKLLLGPIIGYSIDRWGHRFHYVAAGPILWIVCISLLNFTTVHPMVALVFSAIAQTMSAGPLQMAYHLLVADYHLIGTAFGIWRAFSNSGSTVMDVAFGKLQDGTTGGSYFRVLNLALGLKALAFGLGISYIVLDHQYLGKGLTMTRAQRDKLERQIIIDQRQDLDPLTRRTPIKWVTYAGLGMLGAILICAWVLFFMGLAV